MISNVIQHKLYSQTQKKMTFFQCFQSLSQTGDNLLQNHKVPLGGMLAYYRYLWLDTL